MTRLAPASGRLDQASRRDRHTRRGRCLCFSGAEIEQVVNSALYDAFDQKEMLHEDHLLHSMSECVPLSTTRKEEIEHLRNWAGKRTRSASQTREPVAAGHSTTPFRRLEF